MRCIFFILESFSSEGFSERIISSYPDSIIVIYNAYRYYVRYAPENAHLRRVFSSVLKFNNYYLSVLMFFYHHLRTFFFALKLSFRFKPETLVVEGYFLSFLVGLAKILRVYKKSIYISGDWLQGSKRHANPLGNIANNYLFPILDYFSCRLSHAVFDISSIITEKRYAYWSRQVAQKEKGLTFPLFIKAKNIGLKTLYKNLCFLGIMREECGLDVAIRSLKSLRTQEDFHIKVIGAYSYDYENLKRLAERFGVEDFVHFLGFTERVKFADILSDCFCGLHLLKSRNSYNAFSLPAKLGDYLQYVVPVIITTNVGYFKDIIVDNGLGIVVAPRENEFISVAMELYNNQAFYRENIIKYLKEFKETRIEEIVGV